MRGETAGLQSDRLLDKPFNLSDLQIFSHAKGGYVGADPVVQRLVDAVQSGFRQLKQQPRYQDLPAFDALRELGPGANASGTIPWDKLVLMLCSFRNEHLNSWLYVRGKLEEALQARDIEHPRVQRLIDTGSPQLVSQALYENIRRASACVMDWSYYSPSAFVELGVRLVVSPWGALQIVDERFLPRAKLAPRIRGTDLSPGSELQQLDMMVRRFEPKPYRIGDETPFNALLALLVERNPDLDEETDYNRIHRLVQKEIGSVSPAMPDAHDVMNTAADALSVLGEKLQVSKVLFWGNEAIKRDRERAALEYRIAAWLYREHRTVARSLPENDPLRVAHRNQGKELAEALYKTGEYDDEQMAGYIDGLSESEKSS